MEHTLLVVDEKLGETIIEGYATTKGLTSVLEKYTKLDEDGKRNFFDILEKQGSVDHSGVWYSIYVTGRVSTMVRSLGDQSS
ncbi:hypothetical protein SEA_HYDRUS_79 [Gordonia phage Hydrus]|nr:hypothetical protein SEA_HYDRUS_79 [Gordonia phage Hydrus]